MRIGSPLLLGLVAVLATGCASARPDAAFDEARGEMEERLGQRVEWSGVSASEEEVHRRVEELLAGEIGPDEAVTVALLNNRRLQATYGRLGIAAADLAQASRVPNPMLEAVMLFEDGDTDLLELSLVGHFLDALLVPVRKRLAREEAEIVRLEVVGEAVGLAAETRGALTSLQAEVQTLELLRSALLATEASRDMANRLYEAGNLSRLDRLRERDLLEQTKLETAASEMRVLETRERLNRLMGLWGPVAMTWQAAPRLPHPEEPEETWDTVESRVVTANLELQTAWSEIAQRARRAGLETLTTVAPDIAVGVAGEREAEDGGDAEWAVGPLLELPVPIFDAGGPRRARLRAEVRRLWDDYTARAVEVRSHARDAALRLRHARQRADYARDVVLPLRQQITYETQLHYNAMFLGVFELLEAKRREIDAGIDYIDALEDYWNARANLGALLMGGERTGAMNGSATTGPSRSRGEGDCAGGGH